MLYKIYHHTLRPMFNFKGALLLCLLGIGIASCKKSMSDADSLQSKFASGMVSYVEQGNVLALNGNNYSFTPNHIGVPITLTNGAKTNDTVTSVVDPSLVSQYNQIYLEKNPTIPQGAFQVSHQGAFPIASGSTQAKDSLYVLLNDGSQLKDSTAYLVPVTLAAKKGSKLKYSVFFFKVFVTKGDLKAKMYGVGIVNGTSANRLSSGALQAYYFTVPDSIKLRTTLTTLFPAHDVNVQATMLTQSEISAALKKEGFPGIPVPDNTGALTKDLVTIPANSLLSRDSITLKFPNKANLAKSQWYFTGVKIVTYNGSQYGVPPVANDSSRVYIRFFLSN
ncbi:DUF1735 domain-containing protein [Mucilaginibacter paludis]|uniref:BT-3987-like N-terminal domain-containing protein n=1 Tax=Mucilaginibacter paludis DSM 18603 TaxID=714943 RepID=H1YE51_9SPHI|nr:DUF1735 domain-containing protein [Mucilaginibacter paludis]EHQ25229.1 hypothetical protein Mucpa_1057 [Mucilaginibacter paludis DSM 18603]